MKPTAIGSKAALNQEIGVLPKSLTEEPTRDRAVGLPRKIRRRPLNLGDVLAGLEHHFGTGQVLSAPGVDLLGGRTFEFPAAVVLERAPRDVPVWPGTDDRGDRSASGFETSAFEERNPARQVDGQKGVRSRQNVVRIEAHEVRLGCRSEVLPIDQEGHLCATVGVVGPNVDTNFEMADKVGVLDYESGA
jgi:hypothetical protein